MSPAKRFFLILGVVYLVTASALQILFGSSDLPPEELRLFEIQYDRYLEITKSTEYKKWIQGGETGDRSEDYFRERQAYVREIEALPAFKAEQRRKAMFDGLFDLFNVLIFVVIAVRFLRKPLLDFLDNGIAELKHKLEEFTGVRAAAEARKAEAQAQLDNVSAERDKIQLETEAIITRELEEIEESTRHALERIDTAAAARQALERRRAAYKLQQELMMHAIARFKEEFEGSADAPMHQALVDNFVDDVEALS